MVGGVEFWAVSDLIGFFRMIWKELKTVDERIIVSNDEEKYRKNNDSVSHR